MKEGPDIARIAALMSSKALTASELARAAGITAQTASSHLGKLSEGGLIGVRAQGRHRYYGLAGDEVARTLEALMGLAASTGHIRTRTGPKDPALREARVCYNHLAGDKGIQMFRALHQRAAFDIGVSGITLTQKGQELMRAFGIDIDALQKSRTPMCRECLDWSARESHLAGSLGRALLTRIEHLGWARRVPDGRSVAFTRTGNAAFQKQFPLT